MFVPVWLLLLLLFSMGVLVDRFVQSRGGIKAEVTSLEAGVVSEAKSLDAAVIRELKDAEVAGKTAIGTTAAYIEGVLGKVEKAV